jgi:hypothetical protein
MGPRRVLDTKTYWLTVSRNVTWTWTWNIRVSEDRRGSYIIRLKEKSWEGRRWDIVRVIAIVWVYKRRTINIRYISDKVKLLVAWHTQTCYSMLPLQQTSWVVLFLPIFLLKARYDDRGGGRSLAVFTLKCWSQPVWSWTGVLYKNPVGTSSTSSYIANHCG